jgi:hypothetical protein
MFYFDLHCYIKFTTFSFKINKISKQNMRRYATVFTF